jgi:hypothetical protein
MDEKGRSVVLRGLVMVSPRLVEAVPFIDLLDALDKHWSRLNGDGSPMAIFPGLPALSKHTSGNGRSFVLMTGASAEETTAMLTEEL